MLLFHTGQPLLPPLTESVLNIKDLAFIQPVMLLKNVGNTTQCTRYPAKNIARVLNVCATLPDSTDCITIEMA